MRARARAGQTKKSSSEATDRQEITIEKQESIKTLLSYHYERNTCVGLKHRAPCSNVETVLRNRSDAWHQQFFRPFPRRITCGKDPWIERRFYLGLGMISVFDHLSIRSIRVELAHFLRLLEEEFVIVRLSSFSSISSSFESTSEQHKSSFSRNRYLLREKTTFSSLLSTAQRNGLYSRDWILS